ncbi:glycosyltransferase [Desulfobulbus rhabdoformis]|uniref:glycosyltransferase n=1 Tax=Desulfobulbus rhabdoformis TaxID=34032 RepID=UPI0019632045|nr:glycosyltransferase [Desulfobulbus rhabdoformis]MBM9616719.1 glycosyltransferase [Desulfobulbus rhabdoformis]
MKILHIIDSEGLYGAEIMLITLMQAQKAIGLSPLLVCIGTPESQPKPLEIEAQQKGLDVRPWEMRPGLNLKSVRALCQFADENDFSLIHSHGYKGNILLGLMPFTGRTLPLVATLHGWTWTGKLNRMMLYEWLDTLSLHKVNHVVVVNAHMLLHHRLRSIPSHKKSVIFNGLNFSSLSPKQKIPISDDVSNFIKNRFTIVAVGRLSPEKGFSLLIEAVADLIHDEQDIQLLILGEGNLRDSLTAQANTLGISCRVMMPGYVTSVLPYLQRCQLFAMPSLTEGLPMALLEAMFVKIPIVASRVGGIPSALLDGDAGLLIDSGDKEALTHSIRIIYSQPQSFAEMVQRAQTHALTEFTAQRMAEGYLDIYEQVVRSKTSTTSTS